MGTYVMAIAIWVILGTILFDNFIVLDEGLAWWRKALVFLIIIAAAPAYAVSLAVDDIIDLIIGEDEDEDY